MTLGYAVSLRLESGVTSKSYWSGAHKMVLSRHILICFSVELKFELFMSVTELDKMLLWLRKISLTPWVCSGFRPVDPRQNPTKRVRMVSQMAFRALESLHGHSRMLSLFSHEDTSPSYDNSAFMGFSSGSWFHVGSWTCVWMDIIILGATDKYLLKWVSNYISRTLLESPQHVIQHMSHQCWRLLSSLSFSSDISCETLL